jgi:hypothetical protein
MPRIARSVRDRIEDLSIPEPNSGCWLWLGTLVSGRYGGITCGSRTDGSRSVVPAHRASYEAYVGPISDGLSVCHRCDVTQCVNPEHLFLGTHSDNMRDMAIKGRAKAKRGSDHPMSKLNASMVASMRMVYDAGGSSIREVANRFGLSKATVQRVMSGTRTSWVR